MYRILYDPNSTALHYLIIQMIDDIPYTQYSGGWESDLATCLSKVTYEPWDNRFTGDSRWIDSAIYSNPILPTIDTHPELFL